MPTVWRLAGRLRAAAEVDAAEDPAYLRKIIDAAETKDEEEGLLQAKLEKLAMQIGVFGTVPFPLLGARACALLDPARPPSILRNGPRCPPARLEC